MEKWICVAQGWTLVAMEHFCSDLCPGASVAGSDLDWWATDGQPGGLLSIGLPSIGHLECWDHLASGWSHPMPESGSDNGSGPLLLMWDILMGTISLGTPITLEDFLRPLSWVWRFFLPNLSPLSFHRYMSITVGWWLSPSTLMSHLYHLQFPQEIPCICNFVLASASPQTQLTIGIIWKMELAITYSVINPFSKYSSSSLHAGYCPNDIK